MVFIVIYFPLLVFSNISLAKEYYIYIIGSIYQVNNFSLIPINYCSNICVACTFHIDVSITIKQKAYVSNGVGIAPNSLNIKFHHSLISKIQKIHSYLSSVCYFIFTHTKK